MKKLIIVLLALFSFNGFCQNLITVSSKYAHQVPDGKKWILPTNQKILVEVSSGSLNSGSMCNANLFSNPRILTSIIEGEYGRPNEVYGILFKELEKVHYTNDYTYSIIPLNIIDSKFNLSSLKGASVEKVGNAQIVFMPRQEIYVGECLKSIQVLEYTLSDKEIAADQKRMNDLKSKEAQKKMNADEQNRKFMNDWKNEVEQQHIKDSLRRIELNTFPRIVTRYNSYILEYIVDKTKSGKLKTKMVGSRRESCIECDSIIPILMDKKEKGTYKLSLEVTPVNIALSADYSQRSMKNVKEEKQVKLDGAIAPYNER